MSFVGSRNEVMGGRNEVMGGRNEVIPRHCVTLNLKERKTVKDRERQRATYVCR